MNRRKGRGFIKIKLPLCLGVLLLLAAFVPRLAQSQLLSNQEIKIINHSGGSITATLWDAVPDTIADGPETITDGTQRTYSFTGNGGSNFNGNKFTKYIFEINVESTVSKYLVVGCTPNVTVPSGMGFYCPNSVSANNADFDITVNSAGDIEIVPVGVIPKTGQAKDLEDSFYFIDDNWIVPYNLDTYCAGSTNPCDGGSVSYFLTPQTSLTTYIFTGKDVVQPSDEDWDFEDVTLTFPTSKTMTINKGLDINDSTIKFKDNSALIYKGDANAFGVKAGTTFKLGNNVRFTFESAITLAGTDSTHQITFEPLASGDQWEYLDLKADGNDFDWVTLDGGDKTVEVRSKNNTFDHVTFKKGSRGISSYFVSGSATVKSSFTLTNSTVTDNSTVGVVAFHSDLSMSGTNVVNSGQAGIWITSAMATNFANNLIENNAITSTTRSGIEVNSGGILDTGEDAYNIIKNNIYHEISSTVNGQIDLGVHTTGTTGGHNDIYDKGTQATGEKYVSEGSSSDATAEQNCWDTTSEPDSSFFSGTVDYLPFDSCSRLNKTSATIADGKSIRTRILEARAAVVKSKPNYVAGGVAHLYVMQQLDRDNALGERGETMSVIAAVSTSDAASFGAGPLAARERAMLIEIQDALAIEDYAGARTLVSIYERLIKTRSNVIELLFSKMTLYEQEASYEDALRALAGIRLLATIKDDLKPTFAIIESELIDRIEDETGVRVEASQFAALDRPAAGKGGDEVSGERRESPMSELYPAYPNPFNPSTTIPFQLAARSRVELIVFDLLGRKAALLADGIFEAGHHRAVFDAENLPSGSYVLRFSVRSDQGDSRQISRLITLQK